MTDELMTAPELAKYLKVELRTVYRYLKDSQLPAIRMGGRWRFRKEDVDRWLLQQAPWRARRDQRFRILVVDDEAMVREMLAEVLQPMGYTVRGASSGESALDLLKEMAFDLLVVDLQMPGMGGIEFMRLAKGLYPDVRILVLTAHGAKESAIQALRLGVSDYLEKPVQDLQTLASAVELALKP
jgi:excisionase family DNA binding protein